MKTSLAFLLSSASGVAAFSPLSRHELLTHPISKAALTLRGGDVEDVVVDAAESIVSQEITEEVVSASVVEESAASVPYLKVVVPAMSSLLEKPAMKYVLVAAIVIVIVTAIKSLFFSKEDEEVVETPIIETVPMPSIPSIEKISVPKSSLEKKANAQMLLGLLVGGLGVVAGSLAMVAESVDGGVGKLAFGKSESVAPSTETDSEKDGSSDGDFGKKVGVGAAGGFIASGIITRVVVTAKVLAGMF